MLPQFHVTFDSKTFDRAYQYFLPIIPGIFLVSSIWIYRFHGGVEFEKHGLNPYAVVGLLLFAAYVLGCILFAFSTIFYSIVSAILQAAFKTSRLARPNLFLSQRVTWRKVAMKFLGDGLCPVEHKTSEITAGNVSAAGPIFKENLQGILQTNDEWQDFYNALQDYLLRDVPIVQPDAVYLMTAIQATGWAMLCAVVMSRYEMHWTILAIAILFVLCGSVFYHGLIRQYITQDRLGYWQFVALLLKELHAREDRRYGGSVQYSSMQK
jgi:hypothetical protein